MSKFSMDPRFRKDDVGFSGSSGESVGVFLVI